MKSLENEEIKKNIANLLAYSVGVNSKAEPDFSSSDWKELYTTLKEHAVAELCGDVLHEYCIPEEIKKEWDADVLRCIGYYYEYCSVQERLVQILSDSSIPFVILKGLASARYYPHPYLRRMGDIDLLIQPELMETVSELLRNNGFEQGQDEEKHRKFWLDGFTIELHWAFAPLEDGSPSGLDGILTDAIDRAIWIPTDADESMTFPVLPKAENGLVLLEHLRYHMRWGQGLRQIIDWMMYARAEMDDRYWEKDFSHLAEELELRPLALLTTRMCQIYFSPSIGGEWCKEADDMLCGQLMDYILSCGNFGFNRGKKDDEDHVKVFLERRGGVLGAVRYLQHDGAYGWEALESHPELRSIAWLYRIPQSFGKLVKYRVTPGELITQSRKGRDIETLFQYMKIRNKFNE